MDRRHRSDALLLSAGHEGGLTLRVGWNVTTPHSQVRFLEEELERPSDDQEVYARLSRELPEHAALFDFLALRELHSKRTFAIQAERAWFRHFGWRVIRPFMLVAIVAGVFFAFFQTTIDPTLGAMVFLGGAATLYVVIQVFAMFWAQRNQKHLPRLEADYQARMRDRLERLRDDRGTPSS